MVSVARLWAALAGFGPVLGRRCQLCASVVTQAGDYPLCPPCRSRLTPRRGGYCPRCGMCYADSSAPVYFCGQCRMTPPPWSALAFHGPYEAELKELIHQHKFRHDHGLGQLLGLLVRQAWAQHRLASPDFVAPVPMLPRRVAERGFNQSMELARILSSQIGGCLIADAVTKTRDTKPQSTLGRAARLRNLDGAFASTRVLTGKHVLLVDDVMTTGATLRACVTSCLQAGASRVDVFVLARAL